MKYIFDERILRIIYVEYSIYQRCSFFCFYIYRSRIDSNFTGKDVMVLAMNKLLISEFLVKEIENRVRQNEISFVKFDVEGVQLI